MMLPPIIFASMFIIQLEYMFIHISSFGFDDIDKNSKLSQAITCINIMNDHEFSTNLNLESIYQ